jgi:hypothetical protein
MRLDVGRSAHHVRVALALCLLLAAGCASHSRDMSSVRQSLADGNVPKAVEQFKEFKEKKTDLLYLLEKGYMLHLGEEWAESNKCFEAAELRADELYTHSISREVAAFLTSDLTLPYRGMPYELQLVQYYRALNYLELGKPDDALVEARKANFKLTQYAEKNQDDKALRQDAFLQYFTGLLYESRQEVNDAVVSFRDAAKLYRAHEDDYGIDKPAWLDEDYFAAAKYLDLHDEADSLLREDSSIAPRARAHDDNNLVVFFESGFVPFREAVDITLPILGEDDSKDSKDEKRRAGRYVDKYGNDVYAYRADRVKLDHVLRFAFPALVDVPSPVARCELELPDGQIIEAEPVLDLARVAQVEFNDRLPGMLLKTVARAIAKEAARKTAKKEDEALGWLVNAVNVATEQADTRGWIFLPGRIDMLKAELPEGTSAVTARVLDSDGDVIDEWDLRITAPASGAQFISLRSFK